MNMALRMAELEAKFAREALMNLPHDAPTDVRSAAVVRSQVAESRHAREFHNHMMNNAWQRVVAAS